MSAADWGSCDVAESLSRRIAQAFTGPGSVSSGPDVHTQRLAQKVLKVGRAVPITLRVETSLGDDADNDMLDKPLSDAQGNKLNLIPVMPGLVVDITLTSADQRIVNFRADAQALRTLSATFAAAAEVAERAATV